MRDRAINIINYIRNNGILGTAPAVETHTTHDRSWYLSEKIKRRSHFECRHSKCGSSLFFG
jgi:hypothetical protein